MHIAANMNLAALAERMGTVATESDAAALRELLVERFDGADTADIAETVWLSLVEQAVA